ASTHHGGADCPPPPDRSRGYVWPLYDYDLHTCGLDGSGLHRLPPPPPSTHPGAADCPPPPDRSRGYVWPLYDYDLYTCGLDGSGLHRLAASPGYDAEATIAPDGRI